MENAVISECFLEMIAGREVLAALFTTYTFEPDFFELEVIPLLLNQDMAYSTDERVKQFAVREKLREADIPIDVFYDLPMFRKSGDCSPEMEYLCNGVNLGNRAFHGKVNMILLKNENNDGETLLLGAGSNNLSCAGWWDNIECQHWEEVTSGAVPRRLINIIQEDIDLLNGLRATTAGDDGTALERIGEFVNSCRGSNSTAPIHYYGLSFRDKRGSFAYFIRRKRSPLANYNNWKLEIISPFFADDAENVEHEVFLDMGVVDIKLLLPFDSEGDALCQDAYYEHIQNEEGIQWAQWRDDTASKLGLTNGRFRRLHAKVYHFYNGVQSWAFVGSVNFTHKAIHSNIEAGFLTKLDKVGPLLEPIPGDTVIEKFADLDETPPGKEDLQDATLPELYLRYNWVSKCLTGRTSIGHVYEIEILGPEGEPVISSWLLHHKEGEYEGDTKILEEVLRNGSLVKVIGRNLEDETAFPAHSVLLQQIGWSHKPLDLPELTATQILAIYAGMTPERRQMMLIDAKIRELVLGAQGGELTAHSDDKIVDQFFCEYAEIFGAFSKLKKRLELLLDEEQYKQLDYYITGAGVDSLPSLIDRALEVDKNGDRLGDATCYLILLSALEIYRTEALTGHRNVEEKIVKLHDEIQKVKEGKRLKLENNSEENRNQFFKCFEEEFFRVYTAVEDES